MIWKSQWKGLFGCRLFDCLYYLQATTRHVSSGSASLDSMKDIRRGAYDNDRLTFRMLFAITFQSERATHNWPCLSSHPSTFSDIYLRVCYYSCVRLCYERAAPFSIRYFSSNAGIQILLYSSFESSTHPTMNNWCVENRAARFPFMKSVLPSHNYANTLLALILPPWLPATLSYSFIFSLVGLLFIQFYNAVFVYLLLVEKLSFRMFVITSWTKIKMEKYEYKAIP